VWYGESRGGGSNEGARGSGVFRGFVFSASCLDASASCLDAFLATYIPSHSEECAAIAALYLCRRTCTRHEGTKAWSSCVHGSCCVKRRCSSRGRFVSTLPASFACVPSCCHGRMPHNPRGIRGWHTCEDGTHTSPFHILRIENRASGRLGCSASASIGFAKRVKALPSCRGNEALPSCGSVAWRSEAGA
jgi:hypothetical protein